MLILSLATQGSLAYSAALARPIPFFPNTQIEAALPAPTVEVAEAADEPPSTPVPPIIVAATPVPIERKAPIIGTDPPVSSHDEDMAAAGIAPADFGYASYIVGHEGSWRPCVRNGGTIDCAYLGARSYGACQAAPGSKMASAGADWQTNLTTQLKWCDSYAKSRYGGWKQAYGAWIAQHWW